MVDLLYLIIYRNNVPPTVKRQNCSPVCTVRVLVTVRWIRHVARYACHTISKRTSIP